MITIMPMNLYGALRQIPHALQTVRPGEYLFHREEKVRTMYLLDAGEIDLVRYQPDGRMLTLHHAVSGAVLAEASLHANAYHCSGLCRVAATLCVIPKSRFQHHLNNDQELGRAWSAYLSRELQDARYRSELLTRKTVAERLAGWLEWHGGDLPPKGQWHHVAAEIGVSPEAFYRELAKTKVK